MNITLRILYRPAIAHLPWIHKVCLVLARQGQARVRLSALSFSFSPGFDKSPLHLGPTQNYGPDYDERVLPSIGHEVLKAVVVRAQRTPPCAALLAPAPLLLAFAALRPAHPDHFPSRPHVPPAPPLL